MTIYLKKGGNMNRLKLLREEKHLLQSDIANILGVSTSAYGYYEVEKRDIPTEYLMKLADFFDVSTDYILGYSDERNNTKLDKDKIKIGLSTNDYTEITDTQKKQIEDFARFVLKDNEKKNKK